MEICCIDPLTDPRWRFFVESHPDASIFHTPEWLEALRRTYGYEPIAYVATCKAGHINSGLPFCRVNSLLTGRRLVSLPFSDHCQPLAGNADDLIALLEAVRRDADGQRLKYFEIRPLVSDEGCVQTRAKLGESSRVAVHRIDLRRSEQDLLKSFHKDCIRRKIVRTDREQLRYEEGRSEELLEKFYSLQLLTRRRHRLPPQPLAWFRNLIECLGEKLTIRVVSKGDAAIASIITLSFKKVIMDKYSCSDPQFNSIGGPVFLIWRTIQESVKDGLHVFDLGRSDYTTPGLIAFKEHWGAARYPVSYFRYPAPAERHSQETRLAAAGRRFLATVPDSVFAALGGLLYRHAG
jgi:CelD/BcsL family acetyltransferase involved in cellulose biosynthesis